MNPTDNSVLQHSRQIITKSNNIPLGWAVLDWLYPPSCINCYTPGVELCGECKNQIQTLNGHICPLCGVPHAAAEICGMCRENPPAFEGLRSFAVYDGVIKTMIHALKYHNHLSMSVLLGQFLAEYFQTLNWKVDLVVPVPISRKRLNQRGYNQSGAIARRFHQITGIPFKLSALKRLKHVDSQVGLNLLDRFKNVEGVFWSSEKQVAGKRILVIDDVCTSSATMRSCASVLKQAGVLQVFGLTVARAGFYHQQKISLIDSLPVV